MEAKDLRIGNLVLAGDNIIGKCEGTVTGINLLVKINFTAGGCDGSFAIENIEPIRLTEKLLIKFGFKKREITTAYWDYGSYIFEFRGGEIRLIYEVESTNDNDGDVFITNSIWHKSVHQIQNLYFALTGTELEIK